LKKGITQVILTKFCNDKIFWLQYFVDRRNSIYGWLLSQTMRNGVYSEYTGELENPEEEIIFCREDNDGKDNLSFLSDSPYDSAVLTPFSTLLWARHDCTNPNSLTTCLEGEELLLLIDAVHGSNYQFSSKSN